MKHILCYLLSFQLFVLSSSQVWAFDIKDSINSFSDTASVENAAKHACLPKYNSNISLEGLYTDVCSVLRESQLCKNVEEKSKLKCLSYEDENSIKILNFSFLKNCLWGLWSSLEDLVTFIKGVALGTVGYLFNGENRSKAHEGLGEYTESFANYIALEMDEALEETNSNALAAMMVAGSVLSDAFRALKDHIENSYYSLGCYNQEARQERLCKIMGDIIMPPVIALKLIFGVLKLSKYTKNIPSEVAKLSVDRKSPLSNSISKASHNVKDIGKTRMLASEFPVTRTRKRIINDTHVIEDIRLIKSTDNVVKYLMKEMPDADPVQLKFLVEQAKKDNVRIVFGGSRIRGNSNLNSDLDIGFHSLSRSTRSLEKVVKKIVKRANDKKLFPNGLLVEDGIKIYTKNRTSNISIIKNPEEFFMRSGIREGSQMRAGEAFVPSGYISILPHGAVARGVPE